MSIEEMRRILDDIKYRDWRFLLLGEPVYLQVQFKVDGATWRGRKWRLSPHMTKSELVQTVFKAVLTAEEHEVRETFKYRNRAVFGPHIDIDALWAAAMLTSERE